jgi:hypothetical protein
MRAKRLLMAGVLFVSACATSPSNAPPKDSAPLTTQPVVASPPDPLLQIDPRTIPAAYTLKPDAASDVKDYWKECQAAKINLIVDLQQQLSFASQNLRSEQSEPKTEIRDQLIKSGQDNIEAAKSHLKEVCDPLYLVDVPMSDAEIGPGVIYGTTIQIIDDENMLVDIDFSHYNQFFGGHETLWISGYSTQDRVDGSLLVGCFIPAGRTDIRECDGQTHGSRFQTI